MALIFFFFTQVPLGAGVVGEEVGVAGNRDRARAGGTEWVAHPGSVTVTYPMQEDCI